MSTLLYIEGIPPDSNDVERINHTLFKRISGDGGKNRSRRGMRANSILFTVMATCKIRDENLCDVLCHSAGNV